MSRFKLLALDMDGTVLDDQENITAENKRWIQKAVEQGIILCFASGREIQSIRPYMEELGLTTPVVAANGSEVWESPDRLYKRHLIDAEWIERFVALAKRHDLWMWVTGVEGKYSLHNWRPEHLHTHQWLKFGFHLDNDHLRQELYETLASWGVLEITNSHPHNLECNPKGINKASGLLDVCEIVGIDMSEVLAMGDSTNDTAMLRAAGKGIAMGNAQEQVKKIADAVTLSHEEHGVAQVIREIILA